MSSAGTPNTFANATRASASCRLRPTELARADHRSGYQTAMCYHPQLTDVIDLARAVPKVTIAMCHVGGVLGYGGYADLPGASCSSDTFLPA